MGGPSWYRILCIFWETGFIFIFFGTTYCSWRAQLFWRFFLDSERWVEPSFDVQFLA